MPVNFGKTSNNVRNALSKFGRFGKEHSLLVNDPCSSKNITVVQLIIVVCSCCKSPSRLNLT